MEPVPRCQKQRLTLALHQQLYVRFCLYAPLDTDLVIDIIRHLQWPGNDSLESWPEGDVKRPTYYWIYQRIREERQGAISDGIQINVPSKNRVLKYFKLVENSFVPRFIVDPSVFSHSMASVIYRDDPLMRDDKFIELSRIPNVELVQRGLGLGPMGLLPVISFNILYERESALNDTLARLNEINDSFSEIYRGRSFIFPPKSDTEYRNFGNMSRYRKAIMRNILKELVRDPLIPLNNLSTKTGIGRDRLYREYESLARSGLFKIEFSVRNPIVGDILLLQMGFSVENGRKRDLERNLRELPVFRERHLLTRWSFDNVLYVISWTRDYADVLSLYLQLYGYLEGNVPLMFVWQPRTYLNRDAWIRMIDFQE